MKPRFQGDYIIDVRRFGDLVAVLAHMSIPGGYPTSPDMYPRRVNHLSVFQDGGGYFSGEGPHRKGGLSFTRWDEIDGLVADRIVSAERAGRVVIVQTTRSSLKMPEVRCEQKMFLHIFGSGCAEIPADQIDQWVGAG
jgi:hypothetical protein